jgi:hypothetical protein
MASDNLTLLSESLLSKWGFWDGAKPEEFLDWCDEQGVNYRGLDWHAVLSALVRRYLLPELEKNHAITLIDIGTSHNPVRASIVDGRDVEDDWYENESSVRLTPESVSIPYTVVAEVMKEFSS